MLHRFLPKVQEHSPHMIFLDCTIWGEESPPTLPANIRQGFPSSMKGDAVPMLPVTYVPTAGNDMRSSAAPSSQRITQLCPQHRAVQTSQVSFSFVEEDAKSCWESPAQLILAQGSKGAVLRLSHLHQTAGTAEWILSVWHMKPEWKRHLRMLLLFLFCYF